MIEIFLAYYNQSLHLTSNLSYLISALCPLSSDLWPLTSDFLMTGGCRNE